MRQPLVAGNWKMNGNLAGIKDLIAGILQGIGSVGMAEVAVCPPFVYLQTVAELLKGSPVAWGAQNLSDRGPGAFTGEIAGSMLSDFGCRYAIVGHSERRSLYGEDDAQVAAKFAAARKAGIKPILCVGETLEERETGVTEQVVARQLKAVLDMQGIGAFAEAVIAYEPVWAIGTGKTATPAQAQAVHAFIRGLLAGQDANIAALTRILYGGSMKGSNAAELLANEDIDGGLIGGASLQAEEFLTICRAGG
jgi:triosephosphate isomerase